MPVDTRAELPASEQAVGDDGPVQPADRGRGRWRTLATLVGGLALGAAAAAGGFALFGGGDDPAPSTRTVSSTVDAPADLLPPDTPIPPGAGVGDAQAAVSEFLAAEVDGDFATSFGLLDDVGRAAAGSPEGWESVHADVLPRIVDFEILERTEVSDDQESVRTRLTLVAGIDAVVGLTPGEAIVTWDVVRGQDGWGVSLETSPFEPVYPDDTGVVPAAQRWLDDRVRCDEPANEHGLLVGSPALAGPLCGADGPASLGDPGRLDEATAQPVATAFGSEAALVARVVRVSGPVELSAVLVPVGEDWTVIGILP